MHGVAAASKHARKLSKSKLAFFNAKLSPAHLKGIHPAEKQEKENVHQQEVHHSLQGLAQDASSFKNSSPLGPKTRNSPVTVSQLLSNLSPRGRKTRSPPRVPLQHLQRSRVTPRRRKKRKQASRHSKHLAQPRKANASDVYLEAPVQGSAAPSAVFKHCTGQGQPEREDRNPPLVSDNEEVCDLERAVEIIVSSLEDEMVATTVEDQVEAHPHWVLREDIPITPHEVVPWAVLDDSQGPYSSQKLLSFSPRTPQDSVFSHAPTRAGSTPQSSDTSNDASVPSQSPARLESERSSLTLPRAESPARAANSPQLKPPGHADTVQAQNNIHRKSPAGASPDSALQGCEQEESKAGQQLLQRPVPRRVKKRGLVSRLIADMELLGSKASTKELGKCPVKGASMKEPAFVVEHRVFEAEILKMENTPSGPNMTSEGEPCDDGTQGGCFERDEGTLPPVQAKASSRSSTPEPMDTVSLASPGLSDCSRESIWSQPDVEFKESILHAGDDLLTNSDVKPCEVERCFHRAGDHPDQEVLSPVSLCPLSPAPASRALNPEFNDENAALPFLAYMEERETTIRKLQKLLRKSDSNRHKLENEVQRTNARVDRNQRFFRYQLSRKNREISLLKDHAARADERHLRDNQFIISLRRAVLVTEQRCEALERQLRQEQMGNTSKWKPQPDTSDICGSSEHYQGIGNSVQNTMPMPGPKQVVQSTVFPSAPPLSPPTCIM